MNKKLKIAEINGIIQGIALTANAFENFPVWLDCYLEILEYDEACSFEENIEAYFAQQSIDHVVRKKHKELSNSEWQFKLKSNQNRKKTIDCFFDSNLFSNIDIEKMQPIYDELYLQLESCFGDVLEAKSGYIHPIEEMNIYCQHWQHLYVKTQESHLLITFEANS